MQPACCPMKQRPMPVWHSRRPSCRTGSQRTNGSGYCRRRWHQRCSRRSSKVPWCEDPQKADRRTRSCSSRNHWNECCRIPTPRNTSRFPKTPWPWQSCSRSWSTSARQRLKAMLLGHPSGSKATKSWCRPISRPDRYRSSRCHWWKSLRCGRWPCSKRTDGGTSRNPYRFPGHIAWPWLRVRGWWGWSSSSVFSCGFLPSSLSEKNAFHLSESWVSIFKKK